MKSKRIHKKRLSFCKVELGCTLFACVGFLSSWSNAAVEINVAAGYIENPVLLEESNALSENSDVMSEVGLDLSFTRETQVFTSSVEYSARAIEYEEDLLEDQIDITGTGSLSWKLIPEIFTWDLSNTRSMEEIDITAPDTIDNREVVSITNTGPRVDYQAGPNNQLNFELDYALADYEETSFGDQVRVSSLFGFTRRVSSQVMATLNANILDVSFDDDSTLDYRINKLTASTTFITPTYNFLVEAGQSDVKRDSNSSDSNLYLDVNAAYTPNSRSTLTVTYTRSIEDRLSDLLVSGQTGVARGGGAGLNNYDFFELKRRSVSYQYTTDDDYSLTLNYNSDHRTPDSGTDEEEIDTLTAELIVPISLRFGFNFAASRSEYMFVQTNVLQKRDSIMMASRYQMNDRFRMQLSVVQYKQDSSIALNDYESWEALLRFTYVLQK